MLLNQILFRLSYIVYELTPDCSVLNQVHGQSDNCTHIWNTLQTTSIQNISL